MTAEERNKHIASLKEMSTSFRAEERKLKIAKIKDQKRIRYDMDCIILRFENYMRSNWELYPIITGKEGTDFERNIIWDEIRSHTWFSGDIDEAIRTLENLDV